MRNPEAVFGPLPAAYDIDRDGVPGWAALVEVLVAGVVLDHVVAYDTAAGTVRRFETRPDGGIIVRGEAAATETLRGEVVVRWKVRW